MCLSAICATCGCCANCANLCCCKGRNGGGGGSSGDGECCRIVGPVLGILAFLILAVPLWPIGGIAWLVTAPVVGCDDCAGGEGCCDLEEGAPDWDDYNSDNCCIATQRASCYYMLKTPLRFGVAVDEAIPF